MRHQLAYCCAEFGAVEASIAVRIEYLPIVAIFSAVIQTLTGFADTKRCS